MDLNKFWIFEYSNLFEYSNFLKNGHRAVIEESMDLSWWVHKFWIFESIGCRALNPFILVSALISNIQIY